MVLAFRSAVKEPATLVTVQCCGDDGRPSRPHVGILSKLWSPINHFLTRSYDSPPVRPNNVGVHPVLSNIVKDFVDDTSGATAIEYGLIAALIAIAIIGALQDVAGTTITMWNMITNRSVSAMGGA